MSDQPPGWAWTTLGEMVEWGSGGTPRRTVARYYGGSIPWAVIGDLNDGVVSGTAVCITDDGLRESSASLVEPGTVLIAMYGSIGKLGIAGIRMATNQAIGFAHPRKGLDSRFLFWYLRAERQNLAHAGKGATQKNISQTILRSWPLPLPPLNEQRRIVAAIEEHLSRLDAADTSLADAKRRLDRMPAVVLSNAINGAESVRLADVAEVRLGRQRSPKNHAGPNMVPYLRAANVTWRGLDLSDVKSMNFAPSEVATYELRDGDVLLSEASGSADEVGKPAIWRGGIPGCCFQNTLIRVRSHGPAPEYLHKVFLRDALIGKFAEAAPGVGIHHLGSTRLSEWRIPLPPLEEQRRIVVEIEQRLSAIDALRAAIERAQRRSAALRRAVLERAFRGELVPQDPSDEPASALLARIRAEGSPKTSTRAGAAARYPSRRADASNP